MDYLNKFKSTVSSVAAQVTQALPGNPIFREYDVQGQIATAGPGLCWKIFAGTKNSTKQAVAIWLFEKKTVDKWPKLDKEAFAELLKKEESRDNIAFCTEPIFSSLSNLCGDTENLNERPDHLENFIFENIEVEHGLFQLSEALTFLHNDAKILHRNLCPNSVIINAKGAWKLAGFDFCINGVSDGQGKVVCEPFEWNRSLNSAFLPNLDFASPETVNAATVFNKNKSVIKSRGNMDTYKKDIDKLSGTPYWLSNVPEVYKDDLKSCLNINQQLRPDTFQLSKSRLFEHASLKTLNYLESLMQMDNAQKMTFFKGLPNVLISFSKRPLVQKVLPCLSEQFGTVELVPFILPSVFYISQQVSDKEFADTILPCLIPVFQMQRPYQIVLLLLQQMPLLLQKTPEAEVKKHVLPMIYNSLSNDNPRIQELCLSIVPTIGKLVDRDAMRANLLPKLLKLILEGSVLAIRVQTLICLSKLLPTLEPWMVNDQILPALPKINSKEPGVLMAVLGIYKLTFESEKFGVTKELCAKSVLPFLISTMVENTLNLSQFEQYVALTKVMLKKVEGEQRTRLEQLSAGQEEQRNIGDFNDIFNKTDSIKLDDLASTFPKPNSTVSRPNPSPSPMSNHQTTKPDVHMDLFSGKMSTSTVQPAGNITEPMGMNKQKSNVFDGLDDFDPFKSTKSSFSSTSSTPFSSGPSANMSSFPAPPASNNAYQNSFMPPPPSTSNPVNRMNNMTAFNGNNSKADPFADLLSSNINSLTGNRTNPMMNMSGTNPSMVGNNVPLGMSTTNQPMMNIPGSQFKSMSNPPSMNNMTSQSKPQTDNLLDFLN
ncbi:unnamed protein product [Bursaphelenchus okinawaensis]|uniref:Protein kinase domain-containing protein n=1 Tax=Bursaphelenchus okinawaensis TaxID=465554 RepID=A0A811LLJ3_9BILA|nr:unnamed protein product [Bursaphelenchus okinawaensis]CAG9125849.1 unnamed protein product [Bursaphelenchus okinawaensis]